MLSIEKRVKTLYFLRPILELYNKVSSKSAIFWALLNILVVLTIFLYYASGILAFNHNDFMYATAPTLLDSGDLYSDVPYLQTPLTIYLYNFLLKITGAAHLYLALRLYSLAAMALSAFVLYLVVRKRAGPALARLFVILFHSSVYISSLGKEIGNYSTATLFLSLAIFCYFNVERRSRSAALTGLFVGLAAAAKLNFAIYALPFLIFILVEKPIRFTPIVFYILAGIFASSLTLYHLFRDPSAFIAWNLQYHVLANIARDLSFYDSALQILYRSHHFIILSILQLVIILAFLIAPRGQELIQGISKFLWKAGLLAVFSYISAIAPMIIFTQYLGPLSAVVSLLACVCAYTLIRQFEVPRRHSLVITVVIAMAALIAGSITVPRYYVGAQSKILLARGVSNWPIIAITRIRNEISELGKNTNLDQCSRKAVTFSPIFLLGTPFKLTYLSATGGAVPDLYYALGQRAGDFREFGDIDSGLQGIVPTAVLVGYYRDWAIERRLLDYALKNGYLSNDVGMFEGKPMVLYIRGTCLTRDGIE
jgi:hypothetical protein